MKGIQVEFFDQLSAELKAKGGSLSLEQVTDLLPNNQKHRVMTHLNAARNSGICAYGARVVNGKGIVTITLPKPATPTNTPLVGGSN